MKTFVTAGLLFICMHTLAAEPVEDGFYLAVDESEVRIADQGGKQVPIGENQTLNILSGRVDSMNNSNTGFYVYLRVPDGTVRYILVVDNTAVWQGSAGGGADPSSLGIILNSRGLAEKVAEFLGVPLHLREHPGHKLNVTFTPSKEAYAPGEEVEVIMRIENVGTDAIAFMVGGRQRAARDNQYIFAAYNDGKQVEDIGSTDHFGGQAYRKVLQPEETFESRIELKKWFAFDKPGSYEVYGSFYMRFVDVEGKSYMTVWVDYVSAYFYFRVENANK